MTVELTQEEAELLIAILTYAEGHALMDSDAVSRALQALRPWRSALLQCYLRHRLAPTT